MIKNNITEYHCDPWMGSPEREHYYEMEDKRGQVNYRNHIFIMSHRPGRQGRGGSDGSPDSLSITRVIL